MIGDASRGPGLSGRAAVWAAAAVLVVGGAAFAGCGSDDGDETVATPTTTGTEATAPTGPSGDDGGGSGGGGSGGGGGGSGADQTPEDTGPVVPESGGVGADEYDPEQDTEENDIPPPAGGPQEQFEQFCEDNPGACD